MTLVKKKILVIGASGFIGHSFYNFLSQNRNNFYQILGTFHLSAVFHHFDQLNVTSFYELNEYILKQNPDFILFAAGNKNVTVCENDYQQAFQVNTQPIISLIKIITDNHLSSHLIYISTDYVFDGERGEYRDTDPPNPKTNYGSTKYLAEQALINSCIDYKITRTGAVMGKGGIFFEWLIGKIKNEREISMYNNVYFTPTSSIFLCEMIKKVIDNYDHISEKILHIVGEKRLNRYQFALIIKELLKSDIEIFPEENTDSSRLFQYDLSMISSDIINKWRKRELNDYLKDEIINDSINPSIF